MAAKRRTLADQRIDTIVAERAGVLSLVRSERLAIDRQVARKRLDATEAETLKRGLQAFVDKVAIGLHVQADDPAEVRARLRRIHHDLAKANG